MSSTVRRGTGWIDMPDGATHEVSFAIQITPATGSRLGSWQGFLTLTDEEVAAQYPDLLGDAVFRCGDATGRIIIDGDSIGGGRDRSLGFTGNGAPPEFS